jgi:hypothetical protein
MTCAHELSQKQPHHDQEPDALGMTMLSDGMMGGREIVAPSTAELRGQWSDLTVPRSALGAHHSLPQINRLSLLLRFTRDTRLGPRLADTE